MKKIMRSIVLAFSLIAGIYLICFPGNPAKYEDCIVSTDEFENILKGRSESEHLLDALIFDEETLFYDDVNHTFYYSLIEGSMSAYNPGVKAESEYSDIRLVFSGGEITAENIRNDHTYTLLAYTEHFYCKYALKCTTLPLMNIECPSEILEESLPMNITLFDNQKGIWDRLTTSAGEIHIRGASARWYDKKGYRFSLTEESAGSRTDSRKIPLLGMRQDDDWLLYAAYNDPEKIRNVFSSNLWKYTCAQDNAQGVDAGMEYKYIELFMNGEYWGLYALGYPIDAKQMKVRKDQDNEALYKVTGFVREDSYKILDDGTVEGYEVKGNGGKSPNWDLLLGYRDYLQFHAESDEKLYAGIDLDNVIDLYLFYNLIQGQDNVLEGKVKNQYVAIREEGDGYHALYAPWDMDISWGNGWTPYEKNNVDPYAVKPETNVVMECGYLGQLLANDPDGLWEKILEKYHFLRANGWSDENINAMIDEYEADIYGSGAYRRDMERWTGGNYMEPSDGLETFRAYAMRRLEEMDLYYERLASLCHTGESFFIKKSAQYKDFLNNRFIIKINNPEILNDSDYSDFLTWLGIDVSAVSSEIQFIAANPSMGQYDYFSIPEASGMETCAGILRLEPVREGVCSVYLNDRFCYDISAFSGPALQMAFSKDDSVSSFSFTKGFDSHALTGTMDELETYLDALSAANYYALIEINNPSVCPDNPGLFTGLGINAESIGADTDCIVWDGPAKEALVLHNFHTNGFYQDTSIGSLCLFEGETGDYGVYLADMECFVSSRAKNERDHIDVRILLFDPDSFEILEDRIFSR